MRRPLSAEPPSRRRAGFCVAALLALLAPTPAARAGLWDTDTRDQERRAVPGTLELIVGKFARHSRPFLERRVKDRRAKLRLHAAGGEPLPDAELAAAYDDLAVALEKLGRHDAALSVLDEKAAALPAVGRYETAANRGTVLIRAGRLEEGLAELDRALALNPDARFGRERVQKLLVEYLIERRGGAGETPLPLAPADPDRVGFAAFLADRGVSAEEGRRGVEGLLRFGDHRDPLLLEALGDLLRPAGEAAAEPAAARPLAARAYLAAGRSAPGAAPAYRELAAAALAGQRVGGADADVRRVAAALDREFAETEAWFDKLREDEKLWVRVSPDPDARFREKYGPAVLRVGDVSSRPDHIQGHWAKAGLTWPMAAAVGLGGAATLATVWGLVALRRRRPNGWEGAARR